MNQSLYTSLYKYRPSEFSSPLENFTTEALADLLRRLSSENGLLESFIEHVFLAAAPEPNVRIILASIQKARREGALQVDTQQTWFGEHGADRPDLVIRSRAKPIIAVEVKIDAPLGDTQLHRYAERIRERNPAGVLLLLAKDYRRYEDLSQMLMEIEKQHNICCAALRWQHVYEWLLEHQDAHRNQSPISISPINEFSQFLKEKSMAMDAATKDDFENLADFWKETANSVERVWSSLCSVFEAIEAKLTALDIKGPTKQGDDDYVEYGYLGRWWVIEDGWWIWFGLQFLSSDKDADAALAEAYAYMMVGHDSKAASAKIVDSGLRLESGWMKDVPGDENPSLVCKLPFSNMADRLNVNVALRKFAENHTAPAVKLIRTLVTKK